MKPSGSRLQQAVPLLALLSGIACAVLFWGRRRSLWEDEIIAITHGLQPFPHFMVEVLRNDIHPFLYFLLLKWWTAPNIGSDAWALASSLASALFSAGVIAWVAWRVHGPRAALWAAALFCVLPTFAWSASNLRMYGLVPAIAVGCWYVNRAFLRNGRPGYALGILALQFMQAYVHAIGFFFAAFFALAALVECRGLADRRRLLVWFGLQALSLLAMLPVVGSALVRGTEPLPTPDLFSLVTLPAQLLTVWGAEPAMLVVGGLTFAVYLGFGLLDRASRVQLLVIPCGALLACIAVGSLGKPMFKPPIFSACLAPFLALGAGAGIARVRAAPLRLLALGYAVFLGLWLWQLAPAQRSAENYQPAARFLAAQAHAGDVVVVPNLSVFWGVMRYAVGPQWGAPLAIMPRQSNGPWTRLKEKMGPHWVARLGLSPVADHVDARGVRYMVGNAAPAVPDGASVWVVHRFRYNEPVRLAAPGRTVAVRWFGDELSVSQVRPDANGADVAANPAR